MRDFSDTGRAGGHKKGGCWACAQRRSLGSLKSADAKTADHKDQGPRFISPATSLWLALSDSAPSSSPTRPHSILRPWRPLISHHRMPSTTRCPQRPAAAMTLVPAIQIQVTKANSAGQIQVALAALLACIAIRQTSIGMGAPICRPHLHRRHRSSSAHSSHSKWQ